MEGIIFWKILLQSVNGNRLHLWEPSSETCKLSIFKLYIFDEFKNIINLCISIIKLSVFLIFCL